MYFKEGENSILLLGHVGSFALHNCPGLCATGIHVSLCVIASVCGQLFDVKKGACCLLSARADFKFRAQPHERALGSAVGVQISAKLWRGAVALARERQASLEHVDRQNCYPKSLTIEVQPEVWSRILAPAQQCKQSLLLW